MHPASPTVLAVFALAAGLSAQTTRLELGKTVQDDLPGGQAHAYSVKLDPNQYLRAVVTPPSATLLIDLSSPDGKKVLDVNTQDISGKPTRIIWIAQTAGEYRINVSATAQKTDRVHYEIKLEELRPARQVDEKRVEAERVFRQGLAEQGKYKYDRAILQFERALVLFRDLHNREREADTLTSAGSVYRDLSQNEKAFEYLGHALAIRREIKDRRGEGNTLINLANAHSRLSQGEKAIGCYKQALKIFRKVKDRGAEGAILNNLGAVYSALSQYEMAIDLFEKALAIKLEVKDRRGEGIARGNIGMACVHLSQYERAIVYLDQALEIAGETKDPYRESIALINLGVAYGGLSQYEKAIGYWERTLAIKRELKDRYGEEKVLSSLGEAYGQLNQVDKAIDYFEQALAIARDIKNRADEGLALNTLGNAYASLNQSEKAIGYLEQALAIARETKDRGGEGLALNNLGEAYANLSQYQKAIGYYEQALAIAREIKDRSGQGSTLLNTGDALYNLGQMDRAIGYYEQALGISRETKDRRHEAAELAGLMTAWNASGKPRLAIFYGKQAINTTQSVRSDIRGLSQDLQRSFLKGNEKPYHTLAELLIGQGRLAEAEQVLGLLKEEEYFQYIRRDAGQASSLNRRADLTPEEAEYEKHYHEIGDRLMSTGAERGELLAMKTRTPEQEHRLDKLDRDIVIGNQTFHRFLDDMAQHFSAKPQMSDSIKELRETQAMMEDLHDLPAGTVAIFTLIGEDKFYAILRTPDAQKAYEYPIKAADLNRKVLAFHQVVQDPRLDPRPLAQELYKILIGGMAEDLRQARAQTLMWSLDGALRYVPLAALYDGGQYLIEQYRVSVMTLATNSHIKDLPSATWKAAGFGATETLPSVSSELAGIITTKPGDGGVLAGEIELDEQFTQPAMRQMLRKRYPVVHIASHFQFQPGDNAQSFLLLGDGGHLSMAELKTSANLFGGVQLLTLSACNTGMGDGREVEGFGALAQAQGAKAVIASLWPVADESTSMLMPEFYRIREATPGITKLEALRQAQLKLLRGGIRASAGETADRSLVHEAASAQAPSFTRDPKAPYAHPYFWAPFFLMGNWL
jgi:CHAT domain-containing protein/Tfp pilus assembly protein PilF